MLEGNAGKHNYGKVQLKVLKPEWIAVETALP